MIITQAPLRISFLGGGTDFPEFYREDEGCVLSSAIDKYIAVIMKRRFDDQIRVGYTRTELVNSVDEVEHELVREALRLTGIERGVEISTMGDIPSAGSGLGSSSTVTVALLHAMWSHQGELPTRRQLAEEAFAIEGGTLGRPIGIQDQFAAAYGGVNAIRFHGDTVRVSPVSLAETQIRRLSERILLFYTGITRNSSDILGEQRDSIDARRPILRRMAQMAEDGLVALEAGELDALGALMNEGWHLKRQLASKISSPDIDALYERALSSGATGGKISGAGGGGFLLVYCLPERQAELRNALGHLTELEFRLEHEGSLVILHRRR